MAKRLLLLATILAPLTASAQGFQPGRLPAASRDSFEVIYQGQPIGAFILTLVREGDNYTLATDARLVSMGMTMVDSLVFHATSLSPSLVTSSQSMMGMRTVSRVTVADGRATGTTQRPGPAGVQTERVDVAVAPGILADGTEAILLPTLDFSEGLSHSFQTFDAKTGRTRNQKLEVVAKESVTVPAGTFEAWKVQFSGDGEAVTAWVSAADPKRVVMLRLESAQMEMKRVK